MRKQPQKEESMSAGQKKHPGIQLEALDDSVDLLATGGITASGGGGGGVVTLDLDGSVPGPITVVGLQTRPLSGAAPAIGDFIGWDGLNWEPTPPPAAPPFVVTQDVTGNVPGALTVVGIQSTPVSAVAPTNLQVLQLVGGVYTPQTLPAVGPFAVTQDLSGNVPGAITVVGLQTRPVLSAAPGANTFLGWNGAAWAPLIPVGTGPFAVTGDVTGNVPGALTVVRIQTTPVSAVAPTNGQILIDVAGTWTPSAATAIGVEPATPATIPLRTAAGGVRANALSADVGDLLVNHTSAAATAPGDGSSNVYTAQDANTAGNGGEHVFVGGDAATTDATPFIGGGMLVQLGASVGGDPIGATFRVLTSTGDLVLAGGVRGVGTGTQSQDVIGGGDMLPEIDDTSGSIGGVDLRWLGVHAGAQGLVAHGDATNNVKLTILPTSITATLTAVGALGPLTVIARDTLYNGQQRGQQATVTFGSPTTTIDLDTASIFVLTLTGDTTIAFSNARNGARFTLELIQDATGGRTVTWPTVQWPNNQPPVLSRTSGARDIFTFYREGGVLFCESFIIAAGTALGYQSRTATAGTNVTLRVNDYLRTAGTSTATHTLPDATNLTPNHAVTWKETAAGTSAITFGVAGVGGTIDGVATYVSSTARAGLTFVPAGDGTNTWDAFPPA